MLECFQDRDDLMRLTLPRGSSSDALADGLSELPWDIGPVEVKARASSCGLKPFAGAATVVIFVTGALVTFIDGASSFSDERGSLPFSSNCPPSVAHFKMV